ncbi:mechanosensitive ion channel domain-containing protein, partial [Staphylococcus epidermidis]|uniref:mechanosensitive ion channel domain-containing protein n=1 Tax=Staphylococcus epidermidis TaxID=1282 RepID=UPI00119F1B60
ITTILTKFPITLQAIIPTAPVLAIPLRFPPQTILKHIITAFFIIFQNQFDVTDYVKINTSPTTLPQPTLKSIPLTSTPINTISRQLTIL